MDTPEHVEWAAWMMGRRRLLALGASGIAAAVLAACSKDDTPKSTTAPSTADTTATSSGGSVAPTTASSAPPATGTGGSTPAEGIFGGGGGDGTIKIGWVSPATGPLAAFGAADDFIEGGITALLADGLMVGDKSFTVTILREDSESVPDTAAAKALKLINDDAIDLMIVGNTPETTNPVCDTCEANGVPCISSLAPWQPWYFGRNGVPGEQSFQWTFHFFWGLEDVIAAFVAMWDRLETNKIVGGLFPNDGDGNAWGDPTNGFPTPLKDAGYTLVDPGRYENGNQDFTAQITEFKTQNCEVLTGVVIPPDFPTFWKQAKQQGYVPTAASIGKALLFPESIQALGDDGVNLSSEVWWTPNHPYKSSLTGQSAKELGDAYTAASSKQWTQPIGFAHALFEVALSVLAAAGSTDKTAIRDAIPKTTLDTIVGLVDWPGTTAPTPNVTKTKLVGGQWRKADTPTGFDLVVVDNSGNPDVPTAGTMEPISA